MVEACLFNSPVDVSSAQFGFSRPSHPIFDVSEGVRDAMLAKDSMDGRGSAYNIIKPVCDVSLANACLQISHDFAVLIAAGFWRDVVLDCRAKCSRPASFHDLWVAVRAVRPVDIRSRGDDDQEPPSANNDLFRRSMYVELSTCLRNWAPHITSQVVGSDVLLANFVEWLDDCERSFSAKALAKSTWERVMSRGGAKIEDADYRGRYAPMFLLRCMLFSLALRGASQSGGRSTLKLIMKRALRCFPADFLSLAEDVVEKMQWPSPATLCRCRLFMDVAWMVRMREKHREMIVDGGFLFGMLDSSPQGGRNWLMVEYSYVRGEASLAALDSAIQMARMSAASPKPQDFVWEMRQHQKLITLAIERHVLPPAGLGSRHGNAQHKAHARLHSHRLETASWKDTQSLMDMYFSMAVDAGPESKMMDLDTNAESIFPYWIPMDIADKDEVMDSDPGDDDPENPLSLRHVLLIPGTYHMVELLEHRLIDNLEGFTPIKTMIESAAFIFHHRITREAFRANLTGDRLAWQARFNSGPPLFEGGRTWGVLVEISAWFNDRRLLIISAWNEEIGGGHTGVGGQGRWKSAAQSSEQQGSRTADSVDSRSACAVVVYMCTCVLCTYPAACGKSLPSRHRPPCQPSILGGSCSSR